MNELSKIASIIGITTDELLTIEKEHVASDCLSFMGEISDKETLKKIEIIRTAIDEIHFLEELLDA